MTVIARHIITPKSNPLLHTRFFTKIPKHLTKCVGISVVLEFANVNDKLALATNSKNVQIPIGTLTLSLNGRNTATLHVPITLEPILFDGAIDYTIEVPLGSTGEISGHFFSRLSDQNISNLNIKILYHLV
jgi:hypothetical protein